MEIGIIGAGFIGGTLARKFAAAGHRVRIANSKDPSTLSQFHGVAGITPAWAVDAVDIVILSIPEKAVGHSRTPSWQHCPRRRSSSTPATITRFARDASRHSTAA